jgi:hypothetical protein
MIELDLLRVFQPHSTATCSRQASTKFRGEKMSTNNVVGGSQDNRRDDLDSRYGEIGLLPH